MEVGWVLLRMVVVLALVCGVAYGLLKWGIEKLEGDGEQEGSMVRVVQRVGVGPGQAVVVVEIEGQTWVLGSSEAGLVMLGKLAPPLEKTQALSPVPNGDGCDATPRRCCGIASSSTGVPGYVRRAALGGRATAEKDIEAEGDQDVGQKEFEALRFDALGDPPSRDGANEQGDSNQESQGPVDGAMNGIASGGKGADKDRLDLGKGNGEQHGHAEHDQQGDGQYGTADAE